MGSRLTPEFWDGLAARFTADAKLAGERALCAVSCECRSKALSQCSYLHKQAAKARAAARKARKAA